ncbi:MAG TPA: orotidine-5'-phosphate decarboxylase [Phycisphaerae bacterium]|nr:orotidine-5'-phosphate decarboxylase [Phycisphaerae bacterium]
MTPPNPLQLPLFSDRLFDAILARNSPTVVNLDPVYSSLPPACQSSQGHSTESPSAHELPAIGDYCRRVIEIVAPLVPVLKLNIAYFEVYRGAGVDLYFDLVADARRRGLIVIGDVKRGDVGHTATMYAAAQLADRDSLKCPNAVTISGYFGWDGVKPFVDIARKQHKGVFVLVRTSNESAATVQDVQTTDSGRSVHERIGALVADWAASSGTIGRHGYSAIGAVAATRNAADARRLRELMPHSIFLVPGYGAQGGRAEDFVPYFDGRGLGALVAAGRSVIFAQENPAYRDHFGEDWAACIEHACRDFVGDIARVISVAP